MRATRRCLRAAVSSEAWEEVAAWLKNKTVVITGANTGIGYHTALSLAKFDTNVILGVCMCVCMCVYMCVCVFVCRDFMFVCAFC